jgi:hypothetical protein
MPYFGPTIEKPEIQCFRLPYALGLKVITFVLQLGLIVKVQLGLKVTPSHSYAIAPSNFEYKTKIILKFTV